MISGGEGRLRKRNCASVTAAMPATTTTTATHTCEGRDD
ncbi:hypothetical protein E2C01_069668 [Portunus trituberculatus]|uniref:Uncharacterized protein n=1 Tax=Portunus trituberculatus TaxID=210409 RepID=A0A5B7HV59_PORTR|nr:hypothetical protein [Portunus trituberculatus]